jgi:NADPH:quinone reductase-like Zn-dependent oxidoreductase
VQSAAPIIISWGASSFCKSLPSASDFGISPDREIVGTVVKSGENAGRFAIGQRVRVLWQG